jgi:RimJ/RimL family protein N-acetyltransferase
MGCKGKYRVITVEPLEFSPKAVNYVWEIMASKEMRRYLPEGYCPYDFFWLIERWKSGESSIYLPICDGEAMGLCWGDADGEEFEGHYMFFREFWGSSATSAVSNCMELVKKEHGSSKFIGIISVANSLSIAFARRLGFIGDEIINIERYGNCVRLIKEI